MSFIRTFFILALVTLAGCPSSSPTRPKRAQGVLDVLATTAMVADVVRGVGGDHVDVTVLLGPGVDPHLHKTTRDDVADISKADVVFYSGLMLEGKMSDTLTRVGKSKPVVAITDGVPHDQLLTDPSAPDHPDPHVWFDVSLWGQTADIVAKTLAEQLPDHAEEFQQSATTYRDELTELNAYAEQALSSIPEEHRVLITSHDAFGYLGRAYGMEVMGVQGISTDSEAGLQRVNELVDLLVDKKIPSVFIESSVSEKSIEALIDGAKSRDHVVTIGGELFSDAAGPQGTYEGTYKGMVDHNITLIARTLGGTAPDGGMTGRLPHENTKETPSKENP